MTKNNTKEQIQWLQSQIVFYQELTERQAKTLENISNTNQHLLEVIAAKDGALINFQAQIAKHYAERHSEQNKPSEYSNQNPERDTSGD